MIALGALRPELVGDGHAVVEHQALLASLRSTAASADKADRVRALQAQRYATRRREGLIDWSFDHTAVGRKDLIVWTFSRIQKYFRRG
jgi:hypothetical protein